MARNNGITKVDFVLTTNATWDDQLQFGYPDDQSWNFVDCSFLLGVNLWSVYEMQPAVPPTPIVEFTSAGGTIEILDVTNRILALNVPDSTIQSLMPPGSYVYDLIMVNSDSSRNTLCWGKIEVSAGVTP